MDSTTKIPTTAVEKTHFQGPADAILNSFVAADVLTTTTPVTTTILTTTTNSKHVPTPADAILKNPFDTADPQDVTSESEPPTSALHRPTNEELRVARAEKRAAKRAEKHTNAEDLKKQVCLLVMFNPSFVQYSEISRAMSFSLRNSTRKHTYPT